MPFARRHNAGSELDQTALSSSRYIKKFVRDYIQGQPVCGPAVGYGTPTGTTGATNFMKTRVGSYEYHIKGAGQTLLAPTWAGASGLLIPLDQTDDEGVEYTSGIAALDLGTFVVGTDRAFYAKTQITIADVSGTDAFLFGFRKNEAYQAAYTSYTDYAALGITTAAATAAIVEKTRLNTGTAATTDTTLTWADGATKTLEVAVKDDGYVRFKVDGAEPPVTKTNFVFDTGDSVNWFLYWLFATTSPGNVYAKLFEFGYSARRGE